MPDTVTMLRCSKCGETFPTSDQGEKRGNQHIGRHSGKGFNTAELTEVEIPVKESPLEDPTRNASLQDWGGGYSVGDEED